MDNPLLEPLAPDLDLAAAVGDPSPEIAMAALFVARKDRFATVKPWTLLAELPADRHISPAFWQNARAFLAAQRPEGQHSWLTLAPSDVCLVRPELLYVDDLSSAKGAATEFTLARVGAAGAAEVHNLGEAPLTIRPGRYKLAVLNDAFYGNSSSFDCPGGAFVYAPIEVFSAI